MSINGKSDTEPARASGRLWRVGSVVGVPIFVTPSWALLVAFVTVTYADLIHRNVAGSSAFGSYLLALSYSLLLAMSVLLHEVGHTVVSRALGLPVRRIVVFLLGGVSEIVGEPRRPRDEFSIAVAGPGVSFLLAAGCWGLELAFPARSSGAFLIVLLGWSNLIIAVFNVLPGLPLDGGRLVQALVWKIGSSRLRGIRVAAWSGRALAVLLALATLVANAQPRGNTSALAGIGATAAGFAVAAFIFFGAGQSLRQAEMLARARGLTLHSLMRRAIYVPWELPVSEALRQLYLRSAGAIVVIDAQGQSRSIVTESAIASLTPDRHPWTAVGELSVGVHPDTILSSRLAGEALLTAVGLRPSSEYLVIDADGVAAGVLAATDLARALKSGAVADPTPPDADRTPPNAGPPQIDRDAPPSKVAR